MQIDWWTLAFQTINFLVLVWLLQRFLYRPVRSIIDQRQRLVAEAGERAEAARAAAEAERQRLEQARAELSEERKQVLKAAHETADADRKALLAEAQREAERLSETTRDSLAEERGRVLGEMRGAMVDLAVELAGQLLSEAAGQDGVLARIEAKLDTLEPAQRDSLAKELEESGGRLTVVTAAALDEARRAAWRQRLERALGRDLELGFESDPGLIGGAELRFPYSRLRLTWAEALEHARKELAADAPAA